jgi:outer membrane protein assembly factor BamB
MVLRAFNARDGGVAWQFDTGAAAATPAIDQQGDTLCVRAFSSTLAGTSNLITGVAATTGQARWSVKINGFASACAASGANFYLSVSAPDQKDGSMLALSAQNGRQIWKTATGSPPVPSGALAPSLAPDVAAISILQPSNVAAVRLSDGALLWRHDVDGRPESNTLLEIENEQIYIPVTSFSQQSGYTRGLTVYALKTGAHLWSYALGKA